MHDPTKQLMGVNGSSAKNVANYDADPAVFVAGLAVRLTSTLGLSVAKADGQFAGVSLGDSLVSDKKTAVIPNGLDVPILLTDDENDYAFVAIGQPVSVDDATGMAIDPDAEDDSTVTSATWASLPKDAVNSKGEIVGKCALINYIGGL